MKPSNDPYFNETHEKKLKNKHFRDDMLSLMSLVAVYSCLVIVIMLIRGNPADSEGNKRINNFLLGGDTIKVVGVDIQRLGNKGSNYHTYRNVVCENKGKNRITIQTNLDDPNIPLIGEEWKVTTLKFCGGYLCLQFDHKIK